ncbi:hypothetical protein HPB48_010101 [Haemaphysalis longicornis]|uniref:Dolichyl-diphosphooligosaccharide--protein glycosyltransferase subunit DAD1 n=1 Tax=Haemaphysalis longicornis TaxID=44386 RepID=A0A9J6G0S4_HAELO|nr:hypothetical protein HPB48_010101 [Haemaphysalis longicornis]
MLPFIRMKIPPVLSSPICNIRQRGGAMYGPTRYAIRPLKLRDVRQGWRRNEAEQSNEARPRNARLQRPRRLQFVYCCIVGTFPFNSFLSGFITCVASFVLGVCLRLQANPPNKS